MDALSILLQDINLFNTKCYRLTGSGNWSYSIARTETILFYLVLSGSFCIDVGYGPREVYAGETIMIPSAHKHVSYASGHNSDNAQPLDDKLLNYKDHMLNLNDNIDDSEENSCLVLVECSYDKEMIQPLLTVLPPILPEIKKDDDIVFEVVEIEIKLLKFESERERMGKTAVINHWASIMMIECLRIYIESLPEAADSWLKAMKDPYLAKALAAMHEAPSRSWTINKLAEVAGMSRSSFAQRFKEVVGMPPLTYLIDYRLRLAARYLRLQQNSISRISDLVGYASDSTFSQAFKRVYGVSPNAYRQQYKSQNKGNYKKDMIA